jgi:hypothetical protein
MSRRADDVSRKPKSARREMPVCARGLRPGGFP